MLVDPNATYLNRSCGLWVKWVDHNLTHFSAISNFCPVINQYILQIGLCRTVRVKLVGRVRFATHWPPFLDGWIHA